jgi:hypothetical protein
MSIASAQTSLSTRVRHRYLNPHLVFAAPFVTIVEAPLLGKETAILISSVFSLGYLMQQGSLYQIQLAQLILTRDYPGSILSIRAQNLSDSNNQTSLLSGSNDSPFKLIHRSGYQSAI